MVIESVHERAVDAIVDLLNTVSQAAGYRTNLAPSANGGGAHHADAESDYDEDVAMPMVEVDTINVRKSLGPDGGYADEYACTANMHLHLAVESPTDGTPKQKAIGALIHDIEVILNRERNESPPLGIAGVDDLATGGYELLPRDEGDTDVEALIYLDLKFAHAFDDPTRPQGVEII